jgi:hypothetical protein
MAKAALSNNRRNEAWWIYRLVDDQWVEYLHLPRGWDHSHELWTNPKHGKAVKPVSSRAVDRAIASIMSTASK